MSRLASESKADRAPLRNAHRKRKMQEVTPPLAGSTLSKLKPSTMSLPPVSMPKPMHKPPTAAPAQAALMQRHSSVQLASGTSSAYTQPQASSSRQAQTASQGSIGANKRVRHEDVINSNHVSTAAQSPDDAGTETDGNSQHLSSARLPHQTATSGQQQQAATSTASGVAWKAQVSAGNPSRFAKEVSGQSPEEAVQPAESATQRPVDLPLDTHSSMAALADAAAAATEGSAESSSSHAGTDDDKDAAAILRDLRSSPSPQPAAAAG